MNDRSEPAEKRLAEAMGRSWRYHDGTTAPNVHKYFKPLTNANDDYAILEHARNNLDKRGAAWCDFWFELGHAGSYQIGDYARAYLRMLEIAKEREEKREQRDSA